jgi:O-antigen ligase
MIKHFNYKDSDNIRLLLLSFIAISLLFPIPINSISIIIFSLFSIYFLIKNKSYYFLKENFLPLAIFSSFYIVNAISVFYSENKNEAYFDLEIKMSLLLFPLVFFSQKAVSKSELNTILYRFSLTVLFVSGLAVFIGLYQTGKLLINQELANLVNLHASYLSLYVAFAIFIAIERGLRLSFSKLSILMVLALVGILSLLASRAVLVGFFILLMVWVFYLKIDKRKLLYVALIFVLIISSVAINENSRNRFYEAFNFNEKVELDAEPETYKTLNKVYGGRALRVAIWYCALDIVKSDWLLGVGTGDAQDELQQSYKNHEFEFAWQFNRFNAHNLFLQTIISCGILGIIGILALLGYLYYLAFKNQQLLLATFVTLFILISLVESTFNVQKGVVFFAFFSSLFASAFISPTLPNNQSKLGNH